MAYASQLKIEKIEHPQAHYATPDELVEDREISLEGKIKALNIWEEDARQLLTASNEGMPGSEEGIDPADHHMLGQVERAKNKMKAKKKGASLGNR